MGWNPIKTITNIVKNPGKELGNVGKNQLGITSGGWSPLAQAFVGKAPNAPSAGEDPQVTALRNKLLGEATDFETDLPGLQQRAGNQIQREGDMALESGLKGTKQNFNRRGLLYSGLREAGEQGVRGRVASEMSNQKAQSNQDLNKMAGAKYQKAAQVGLQSYQQSVDREAEIAGINLQNQVARAQVMQQLGQTGGYMAGSYFANRGGGSNGLNSDGSISTSPGYTGGWNDSSNQFRQGNLAYDTTGRAYS